MSAGLLVWLMPPLPSEMNDRCPSCLRKAEDMHDSACAKAGVVVKGAP